MTLDRGTKARLTTGLILLLVLATGVMLGIALDRQATARAAVGEETGRREGRTGPDGRGRGFDPRSWDSSRDTSQARGPTQRGSSLLVDQVGLSGAQKEQVDSIVGYFRAQMRELHEEFDEAYSTRYRELNQRVRDEVRAILTVEQREAYDSLQAEWMRMRQERRQDSVPGPGRNQGERQR